MRVFVTGAGGQLAAALLEAFRGAAEVRAETHAGLDITDEAAVERAVASWRPDVIINGAAYNDVDAAEDRAEHALRVNGLGPLALARAARAAGARLVHYSTDFVFDGETTRPYVEEDAPNPRNVYAASKLLGEWFAAEAPRHYVLRVESLFGGPALDGPRRGSLDGIVDRIRAGLEVSVFVDRTVSPAYMPDVAMATRRLLEIDAPSGLYHCVNTGAATWKAIAVEAARLLGRDPRLREVTLEAAAMRAQRPRFCALSNARLASVGVAMPDWQDALGRRLAQG